MRDFSQTKPYAAESLSKMEMPAGLSLDNAPSARGREARLPVGLIAAATLQALASAQARATDNGYDAWLDRTLEESFPASDPFTGKSCN